MEITVKVEAEIVVKFDEYSKEFQELFEGYKSAIDSEATYESLAESICSIVARYGTDEQIEGIGYVNLNGENQTVYHNGNWEKQPSNIDIEASVDLNRCIDFDTEVIDNNTWHDEPGPDRSDN